MLAKPVCTFCECGSSGLKLLPSSYDALQHWIVGRDVNATIILTTGKGGVGKTTLSAVTAIALAGEGRRTVVVSVDPAHSLADVLDCELTGKPIEVAPNLDALEVRLSDELRDYWGKIQHYLVRVFQSQGVASGLAEDVAYLPGLEEIVALLRLQQLAEEYDRVVVDCPPTGSTLRYLNLPEAIRWYMEKFFPTEKKIAQAIGPLVERFVGVPMPDSGVLNQIEHLFERVLNLRALLIDPGRAVAQVVCTPETVVLKEAERAVGYLHVHQLAVGRVLLNRSGPGDVTSIDARFAPVPVFPIALRDDEPIGLPALEQIGKELFADISPTPQPPSEMPLAFEVDQVRAHMRLQMPKQGNREQLKVGRHGDDIIIDMGPVRRHIPLPPAIARQTLKRAAWYDSGVQLEFQA